jgi:methionine synthase II (cobalamin-independent)
MKKLLASLLLVGILAGCSEAEELEQEGTDAVDTIENEGEEAAEEIGDVLEDTEEAAEDFGNDIEQSTEEVLADMNEELQKAEEEIDEALIGEGESAVVTKGAYAALTEEAYDEMFSYIETSDYDGIEEMKTNGDVVFMEEGTEVTVEDRVSLRAHVKTTDGMTGYLPVKLLEPTTTE